MLTLKDVVNPVRIELRVVNYSRPRKQATACRFNLISVESLPMTIWKAFFFLNKSYHDNYIKEKTWHILSYTLY